VAAENDYIGKFRLIRKLGEGGMGSVYLAQDQRVKPPRMVAIKLLRDDNPELRERFAREVGIIANFEHPNIVHVFEVDEHAGHPFMAMAYVKGETLLEMIKRKAPMPLVRKLQIIEHLCAGLAYAHRQGVVHRDIKPGNVMIDSEETLKILDFGIAKLADSTLTVSGSLVGTPNYMSPEQIMGEAVGPQSDIFAVGCLSYEILTYQQAFPGKIPEVLGRIQYSEPIPLRDTAAALDGPIAEIIERALKKNPPERYQDLSEMQRDVAKVRKRLEESADDKTIVETRARPEDIAPLLSAAREALTAGDYATARARAADVLHADTRNAEAREIDRAAHAALVDRQNREWLEKAREYLAADNLTAADELLQQIIRQAPNHPDAATLRTEISQRRQRQENEVAQKRAIARALARAEAHLVEGAFEAATRALDEVFAVAPAHPDALKLADDAKAGRKPAHATAARQHFLETIRMDVQAAINARNADLAERLTRELADGGADPKELEALRTKILTVRHESGSPAPRTPTTPVPAVVIERKPLTEADKMARAGLRAFYQGEYAKALDVLERIPKTAVSSVQRERVVFYMACSNAALALLEGRKGALRLDKARKLFQLAQPEKNPFTLDRKHISPEILGALEGRALAQKV
jgi:tetratricopeptide (TPR) repeat protein/predicted Ser/Thr protein kinase